MDRLSEIRARCERATPGPWEAKTNRHPQCNGEPWGWISGATGRITWSGNLGKTNAAFIANAREDIPFLLAEVERLTARAEKAEAERDKAAEFIRWVDDNFSHYMPQEYTDRLMTLERNHFKSPQEGE